MLQNYKISFKYFVLSKKNFIFASLILANHNKDYSVVKTLGSCPSSFNGGLFVYTPDISQKMLTNTLRDLEADSLVGWALENFSGIIKDRQTYLGK